MKVHPLKMNYIGKSMEVIHSKNRSLIGVSGLIVEEGKNTFKILDNENNVKIIPKNVAVFRIGEHIIDGAMICKRPEERIKMKIKNIYKTKQKPLSV